MEKYNLVSGSGFIEINENSYPVNSLYVVFNGDKMSIWSITSRVNFVPATIYSDYQDNGVDFASKADLKTYVQANFFELASGSGGGGGDYIPLSDLDASNGVPQLVNGKIKASQLPASVMELQGYWNASTNSPSLADGVGNPGDVYIVSVAGTRNLGSGSITFALNDWVVYAADNIWHKSSNAVDTSTVKLGGNTMGTTTPMNIGTVDNNILNLYTNNVARISVSASTNTIHNATDITYGSLNLGSVSTSVAVARSVNDAYATFTATNSSQNATGNIIECLSNVSGTTAVRASISKAGNVTANSFIKSGGTSGQFLKADGSVDTSTYLTAAALGDNVFVNGGNAATANMTLGITTSYQLTMHVNGADMMMFYPTQGIYIKGIPNAEYLMVWTTNLSSTMARLDPAGNFMAYGFVNRVDEILAAVKTPSTGVLITRDMPDTYPALITNLINSGSTANIQHWQFTGTNVATISKTGTLVLGGNIITNNAAGTPTHSITIPNVGTGIALYNTVDQTTNYERVRSFWSSNVYTIASEKGGTSPYRMIRISSNAVGILEIGQTGVTIKSDSYAFNVNLTNTLSFQPIQTWQFGGLVIAQLTSGSKLQCEGILNYGNNNTAFIDVSSTGISMGRNIASSTSPAAIINQNGASSTGNILSIRKINSEVVGFTIDGDLDFAVVSRGTIIKSPNGTRYRVTVSDAGVLAATAV